MRLLSFALMMLL